jgi:hypothetical protein
MDLSEQTTAPVGMQLDVSPTQNPIAVMGQASAAFVAAVVRKNINAAGLPGEAQNVQVSLTHNGPMTVISDVHMSILGIARFVFMCCMSICKAFPSHSLQKLLKRKSINRCKEMYQDYPRALPIVRSTYIQNQKVFSLPILQYLYSYRKFFDGLESNEAL